MRLRFGEILAFCVSFNALTDRKALFLVLDASVATFNTVNSHLEKILLCNWLYLSFAWVKTDSVR